MLPFLYLNAVHFSEVHLLRGGTDFDMHSVFAYCHFALTAHDVHFFFFYDYIFKGELQTNSKDSTDDNLSHIKPNTHLKINY